MKKNLCIILGLVVASLALANNPFEKAMRTNIPAVFSSTNPTELQEVINQLNRIGEVENERWEPHYYAAFGYLKMSEMHEAAADKDKYLDLAMGAVEKAEAVLPNDSELEAMRGYILMIKLTVDPAARGMEYSGLAFTSFQKAISLNPKNPRAHYLMGRMQYGTAQFMGGGSEEACQTLDNALKLFNQEQKSSNEFAPTWGKQSTERSIAQICRKE